MKWLRYVKYKKVDATEISEQLWNCLDTALQKVVSRALEVNAFGLDVDTITQDKWLMVTKVLAVEVKAVYNDNGGKNDTFTLTDVISQIEEHAVVVVDEDRGRWCLRLRCCHFHMDRVGARKGAPREK